MSSREGNCGFFSYPDIMEREGESSPEPGLHSEELRAGTEPGVEIHHIDDEVKVITELPGVTREALSLTVKVINSSLMHIQGPGSITHR
jgi:HSP20 family molecular chaperone IbpA